MVRGGRPTQEAAHAIARDSSASASGSQCFISMARSIAMARQTVHRAKSEAGYAPAPRFQDSMPAPLMPA